MTIMQKALHQMETELVRSRHAMQRFRGESYTFSDHAGHTLHITLHLAGGKYAQQILSFLKRLRLELYSLMSLETLLATT